MSGAPQGPEHRPQLHERAYRVLLYGYPKSFRAEFGDQMMQEYRTDYRGARRYGRQAAVEWWVNVLVYDLVRTCVEQRSEQGAQQLKKLTSVRSLTKLGSIAAVAAGIVMLLAVTTSLVRIPHVYARAYAQDSDLSLPLSLPLSVSYPVYLGVLMSVGYISLCLLERSRSHLGAIELVSSCSSAIVAVVATYHEMSTINVYITSSDSGIMTATQGVDNTMAAMLWLQAMTGAATMLWVGTRSAKLRALGGWEPLPIMLGILQLCPLIDIFFGLPPIIFFEGNVLLGTGWVVLGSVIWRRATAQRVESNVAPSN